MRWLCRGFFSIIYAVRNRCKSDNLDRLNWLPSFLYWGLYWGRVTSLSAAVTPNFGVLRKCNVRSRHGEKNSSPGH